MSTDKDRPGFRYSDEQEDGTVNPDGLNPKYAIYNYNGKDYKVLMSDIRTVARIYALPFRVQEEIYFWGKMLQKPD